MGSFPNSNLRKKVFKEAIQQQPQFKMILLKYYWVFLCLGTNYPLYFNDMQLITIQNRTPVLRYGTSLNRRFDPTIVTLRRTSTSFESQEKTFELMLHSVRLRIILITL